MVVKGSFSKAVRAGTSFFFFRGRVGGHALKAGSYRLSMVAKDAAGNVSGIRATTFKIVSH